MRKKQYIHPECSCDEISFSLLQSSGTNIYDKETESGLIRTNATEVVNTNYTHSNDYEGQSIITKGVDVVVCGPVLRLQPAHACR